MGLGGGLCPVHQDSYADKSRNHLLQKFQSFPTEIRAYEGETRNVSAWPSQARDKPAPHRVACCRHDDRNSRSCILRGRTRISSAHNNDVNSQTNQFGGKRGKTLLFPFCEPILNDDVPPFNVP